MAITDTTYSEYDGIAAPAVSPAGKGRIYFDSTTNTFRISQNTSTYSNLASAAAVLALDGPFENFASGAVLEQTPVNDPFPTLLVWYTDGTLTLRIVDEQIAYNADGTVDTDTYRVYAVDGVTVVQTFVDTYDYSGGNFLTPHVTRTHVP